MNAPVKDLKLLGANFIASKIAFSIKDLDQAAYFFDPIRAGGEVTQQHTKQYSFFHTYTEKFNINFELSKDRTDSGRGSEQSTSSTQAEAQTAVDTALADASPVLKEERSAKPGNADVLNAGIVFDAATTAVKKGTATNKNVAAVRDAAAAPGLSPKAKSALSKVADALSTLLSFVVKAVEVIASGMSSMMGGGLGCGMFGQRARVASRIQEPGYDHRPRANSR